MKNLPEKIYIRNKSPKLYSNIDKHNKPWSAYEHPLTDKYEEYICADIAEQIAKEFAMIAASSLVGCENGSLKINNFDELFTEFINSRKGKK